MTKVTRTKALTKGEELVVIPKQTYERMQVIYHRFSHIYMSDDMWREMEADVDIHADRVTVVRTKRVLQHALAQMKKKPTLKAALANFTPDMVERVNWGRDVGKEVIA